jgi:Co/Zn/Cd efflux system component
MFSILYAIIAILATFFIFATLHDLSKDKDDISSSARLEQILEDLLVKVVPILYAAVILEIVVYGSDEEIPLRDVVQRAMTKAVFWSSLCKVVSIVTRN